MNRYINKMNKILLRQIILFIIITVFMAVIISCTANRYKNRSLEYIKSCACYEIVHGKGDLDSLITKQILDPALGISRDDTSFTGLVPKRPNPFSPTFEILLDPRLMNDFLLVFTTANFDSVIGYVRQIEPAPNKVLEIPQEELIRFLKSGLYFMHIFYNGRLLAREKYIILK